MKVDVRCKTYKGCHPLLTEALLCTHQASHVLKTLTCLSKRGMKTYALDGECSDRKVSIGHDWGGGDVKLLVRGLIIFTNVISPILLTLALWGEGGDREREKERERKERPRESEIITFQHLHVHIHVAVHISTCTCSYTHNEHTYGTCIYLNWHALVWSAEITTIIWLHQGMATACTSWSRTLGSWAITAKMFNVLPMSTQKLTQLAKTNNIGQLANHNWSHFSLPTSGAPSCTS